MSLTRVTCSLIDLWAEPRFQSERVSQAFFGEELEIRQAQAGFFQVIRQRDQYSGWVDARLVSDYSRPRGTLYRVKSFFAKVINPSVSRTQPISHLFYGTEVTVRAINGRDAAINFGARAKAAVPLSSLRKVSPPFARVQIRNILRDGMQFLGMPYLWGGVSPLGFDCSGFVQTLFGQYGIPLPRDTKEQRTAGLSVQRTDIRPGDLLFSPGHVVIALGDGKILHSSRASGGVAIQSLNRRDDTYRRDLDEQFEEARRVLPSP